MHKLTNNLKLIVNRATHTVMTVVMLLVFFRVPLDLQVLTHRPITQP